MQLTGATKEEKLKNAIMLYANMEKWYFDFLESEKGKSASVNLTEYYLIIKGYRASRR